jgi:uncharacterized membrane-anchored protein
MKKSIALYSFIAVSLIQLAVPMSMISKREATLKQGRQYKFKTAPVDPYDAFRGRFVALRMGQDRVAIESGSRFERGQAVYILLEEDEQGFASLTSPTLEKPDEGYIKARVRYTSGTNLYLNLPFDRYYMNEKDAPAAEAAYRKHSRRKEHDAYITVRVKSGFAVLEHLYVGDMTMEDFLKKESK